MAVIDLMYFVTVCFVDYLVGWIVNKVSLLLKPYCVFLIGMPYMSWVNATQLHMVGYYYDFVCLVYNMDYIYARGASSRWPSSLMV